MQGVPPYKPDQGDTPWNPEGLREARQSLAFVRALRAVTLRTRDLSYLRLVSGQYRGSPPIPPIRMEGELERQKSIITVLNLKDKIRITLTKLTTEPRQKTSRPIMRNRQI